MDIHARVSKDLLEPGPTVIEIPVAAGEIVKNGLICSCDLKVDYSTINDLESSTGRLLQQQPTYLETIPPPSRECIQLHRLEKGQNMAHLLVLYHHFGASTVIFINTSDNYELQPELMATLAVAKKNPPRGINCILISLGDGKKLIKGIEDHHNVFCWISSSSCADDLHIVPDHYPAAARKPKFGGLSRYKSTGYIGEEMQKILKVVSQNAAISHHDFQVIMTACEKMEGPGPLLDGLMVVDDLLVLLLQPTRFGRWFQCDYLLYVALAHRIISLDDKYLCDNEKLLKIFCRICIEGLCDTHLIVMLQSLDSFKRTVFQTLFMRKHHSIRDLLGSGFLNLCSFWVKDKKIRIPPRYWDIAMLCITFAQKLFTYPKERTMSVWKQHIANVKISSRLSLEDEDFYYLQKGVKYMGNLQVARQYSFTPAHFTEFLLDSKTVIRPLSCIKRLIFCFSKMKTDFWENHLKDFLVETAEMYYSVLNSKQPKYAAITELEGMYGVFQEIWYFMAKTIEILEDRNCYNNLVDECSRWMSVLLFVIDFSSADGLQCITFFVEGISHLPKSLVTHCTEELNNKFLNCCRKLPVEQFQPIFSAASFWKPEILQRYLQCYAPQPNIVICNDMWQQLLQAASDSPLQCSKIVVDLLRKTSKQYSKSKRSQSFIVDLISLNTPKLLLDCESEVSSEFTDNLRGYIKILKLRESLVQKYIHIIESTSLEKNYFMMLVISATMEEVFIEVKKDEYQVFHNIIVSGISQQLTDILKAANYTSVRAKCVFGTLQKISSHVQVAKEDLSWLIDHDHVQLLIELCRCFQVVCKHISHSDGDLDADVAEFLEEVKSPEFETFVTFCQDLQSTLQKWKQKVTDQNVIIDDIKNLKLNWKWFNLMCDAALVSSSCIDESEVKKLAFTYEEIETQLGDILFQQIPNHSNRSYLPDVLVRLGVALPSVIEKKITKLVISSDMLGILPLSASSKLELNEQARIPDLNDLLINLRTFIQPLGENLKAVVFFHLQNSRMFFAYANHFMVKVMEKQPVSPGLKLTTTRVLVRDDHSKNIEYAAASVKSALALVNNMCMGTATHDEVTLNGLINLSNTEMVDFEIELFITFASSDLSRNLVGTPDGLYGLQCFAELDAINKYIGTITDVLRQFKLRICLESDEYNVLQEADTVLADKGNMSLNTARETLQQLKDALHLKSSDSDLTCFRIFESVRRCANFYHFAEKSKFTGPTGKKSFIDQYRIVQAQVQHEDFNQAILHHLYGSYDYIAPFFNTLVTFSQLMTAIMDLKHLDKGIEHLETVSRNIVLIEMWFRKVEGETTENIEKTLNSIRDSGQCTFFTCDGGNTVEFQLVYNPYCQPSRKSYVESAALVASEYEKWSLEQMNEFALKLGFIQCDQQGFDDLKRDVMYYQQVFKFSVDLLYSYRELKALGHPDYQKIDKKLRSTLFANALDNEVKEAKEVLEKWKENTEDYRKKHIELAFFSNEKVMRILRIIQEKQPAHSLVKEIDFLFECDSEITEKLTEIVKTHLPSLTSEVACLKLPVEIVGLFLQKVIMERFDQDPVSILSCLSSKKLERSLQIDSRFTLHSVHNFTPEQMLQLIFTVFKCVPKSFQLLKCSTSTTRQQLELFFNRIVQWRGIQYLIIGVDCLSNELQEMLVQKCSELESDDETKVDFIECCQSVLRLMPSVSIYECRDSSRLSAYSIIHELMKEAGVLDRYLKIYLVTGLAGDGKTHYIRKEMRTRFSKHAIFSLNESFEACRVIKQLQSLSTKPGVKTALHLNFTFVLPASSESAQEKEQYRFIADQISWFLMNLLLFGYVEDACTGVSFRLPNDAQWTVYVEIPCINDEIHHSLDTFVTTYPAFKMLGQVAMIDQSQPYDIDHRTQLVCKYLKAKKEDKLNQLAQQKKGKLIEVKIGKVPNLTDEDCRKLLDEFMPEHVARKITKKLYLRYMFRRCQFLEESPYLKFNAGSGILKPGQREATDTSKLRSVLFETMLDEVSDFCQQYDQRKSHYHQLVYDFRKEGDGNFSLLSEAPDRSKMTREQEKFVDFGFDLPSPLQLRKREKLDKLVSMALGVPYNESTGHIDLLDKKEYVMTLDYAVKMLTIHERRLCGVPVVIKGESGVGKTFLLETLSSLWNYALLADLELERSRLRDTLNEDLSEAVNSTSHSSVSRAKEIDDALNNTSDEVISIATLTFIMNLKPSNSQKYHDKLRLLKTTSVLSILELPSCVEEGESYSELFRTAENASKSKSKELLLKATVQLMYCILYGKLPETFHKISVNAALMPSDITKLFEPILEQANLILERSRNLWGINSMMDELKLPVVTVFLDEINTSSCLGVLKEIVIDGTLDGKEIPRNVFIVAACNPYRGDSLASLKSDSWFRGSYYVRPLHPTLELLMWDYKALDPNQEREYVFAKMSLNKSQFTQSLMNSNSDNVDNSSLTDQIVKSQDLVRQYAYESLIERMKKTRSIQVLSSADEEEARVCASSTVSQRDIQRVFRFYSWLQKMFETTKRYAKESKMKVNLRAVYVSMALVYYFRLDSDCRAKYLKEMNNRPVFSSDKEPVTFSDALQNELDWLIENISLPDGVAATEALKENLYSIVICTMTRTPLIILGPPGSSKTLSFKIVISNLQGMASINKVFRLSDVFHALEPTFYQCSRRSTSTEIDSKFETAIKNQKFYDSHCQNSYSVVIMDEAGLPEESHESLKVLHVHLDTMAVSFVAISNHVLDAAKTNRAVSLFRPETSKEDVIKLAEGCLKEKFSFTEGMCEVYLSKMKIPEFRAFYGLRDFIHFCTFLHHYDIKSPQTVLKALERNFNGSHDFKDLCEFFLHKMGSSLAQVEQRSVLAILRDSLLDKRKDLSAENEVRYKLIIDSSEDESIIRFLFTYGILQRDRTRLYICSKFSGDGEAQKINTIAAIRHSAVLGHTVILSQTDEIHETFYDLFNQRFTCIDHPKHGKLYFTNIAIGPHVKPSKVDPHFQCVVVIKKSEQHCTPAPFLNRFEKYALSHQVLLQDVLDSYPNQLRLLIDAAINKVEQFLNVFGVSGLYGQNDSTLQSLLLTVLPVYSSDHEFTFNETIVDSTEKLLHCLLSVIKGRLNLSFPNVKASLSSAAEYVARVLTTDLDFSGILSNLLEQPISSSIINDAVDYLVNKSNASTIPTVACKMVIAFLLQWLVTYLCERLMQLVTPEALIINHKKIPSYYMNVYLNQQHHFKLKELITDYHSALRCKDTPYVRSVPNKLLCFSRSSSLIHTSTFDEFPIEGKSVEDLERLVFSYPHDEEGCLRDLDLRLRVTKVTNSTTQSSITSKLKLFCTSETFEVMVFVVNMQHFSVKIVNHLRIMIEEAEVLYSKEKKDMPKVEKDMPKVKMDMPKLFVVFLHFPPEMFFSHCYPSLFLFNWDHYYLDTIAPSEENAVIDISQWFSYFCISENCNSEQSNFLLEPLRKLMEKAVPVLATRFSVAKNGQLPNLDQHKANLEDLKTILVDTQLGTVLQKQFASYWQATEMADFSEQAANFPHMYESTLSITDAIHTIVRSSFYDYLFYILSVLKKESVLIPFLEADKSGFKDISLEFVEHFPKPRTLSHLKVASMSVVRVSKEQLKTTKFPFFHYICGVLKNLLDQCEKDVQRSESDLESSMDSQPMSLGLRQSTNSSPREALCYKAEEKLLEASMAGDQHINQSLSQKEDLKFLQFALEIMGQDSKRWTAYFDDFMAVKFDLVTNSNSPSVLVLRKLFSELDDVEIQRRAIELHAYIKLNQIDSNLLELLRYVDNLYQDPAVSFQPAGDETSAIEYFEQLNSLLELVISSLYDSLRNFLSQPDRLSVSALKNLSGYFYTLISNPVMKKTIDDISCHKKAMLQVLYATFLMLFSEVENTAESTIALFSNLDVLLSKKDGASKELTLEEVVIAVAQTIVDTNASSDTIVEVLTLPYNASFHYMLEGVFENFLCTPSVTDLNWFLKLANSSAVVESLTSSQQRMTLSAYDVKHRLLILLISSQDATHSSSDTLEKIFSSKLCCTLEEFLSSCVPKSDTGEPVCVPVHYCAGNPIERGCPLLHIYCNLVLQVVRNRNMSLQDVIRLNSQVSTGTMSRGVILRTAEQQATVQCIIEKLSQLLTAKEYNVVLLSEIYDDANNMLGSAGDGLESHGLMLALQLLRDYSSSRAFIEAMVAKNGVYTDFKCLLPIHRSLTEKEAPAKHKPSLREPFPPSLKYTFPFNMMVGNKTDEQVLYGRIKKVLTNLHRAPKREEYSDALQKLIGDCYGEGALIKSGRKKKHIFNMLIWLCIYYEFYCREKSCLAFAGALKENFSQYNVEPTFLSLLLMFANSQQASWDRQPPVVNPKTIGELFRSKDVGNVELRDTLAHLVAAVLGSCEKPCHLNHHLFSPQELSKTLVPGATVQVAIGVDNTYDKATKLVEGPLPGLQQVASIKTHTMSLQCFYFTLWTNYGALCVNQLLNPNTAKGLLGEVFPQNFLPLQYCFERMVELWNILSTHLCLTTENRFIMVNNVLERVYKHDFENNQIVSNKVLNEYQKEWNEVFVNGWVASKEQELQKPLLPHPVLDEKLSQLDRRSPVFASIPSFLLQLFSSTDLDNQSCCLYVLYQFVLRRSKLNIGGILLPGLVRIYWWLHNELNYTLSLEVAKKVTVGEMRLYLERKCQDDEQRKEVIGLINAVKVKYQEYREMVESSSKLPELTFATPLVDLLSTSDEHGKSHGILYKVMLHIVDSYNLFLKDIKDHGDKMLVERYMKEDFSKESLIVSLAEVDDSTCCFGSASRLDDLDDILPLISKCCSIVAFRQINGPLVTVDSTLLPCCVPQQFDLICLQNDIAKSFLAGKRLVQMPEGIYVKFQFKEQSRGQPITGNISQGALFQMAALDNLEHELKGVLDDKVTRRTEYECHSMKYYTLLEVTIGLRTAVGYLVKDGFQISRDMETLSHLVKNIAESGSLNDLGIQRGSLTSSQSHFLLEMKLTHVFMTQKLLLEWLELGMYDFCSLPFAMKAHLTDEDKHTLADTVQKHVAEDGNQALQDLKSLQTVLVQADSKLRQSAVNGEINAPLNQVLCRKDCPLLKTYLTDGILVCHYVHLRLELRRLYKQVQKNTVVEIVPEKLSDDEKWNDRADDDLWSKLKCTSSNTIQVDENTHGNYGFEEWIDESLDDNLLSLKKERQEFRLEEQQDKNETIKSEDAEAAATTGDKQTMNLESTDFQEHLDEKALIAIAREKKHSPTKLANFLGTIGLDCYAENVIDSEVSGDMLVGPTGMSVLKELDMEPIEQLRCHVLYHRHLSGRRSRLAEQCPVEKVVHFFEKHRVLRDKSNLIEQNNIDGEMLLQASQEAIGELGITSIGWKIISNDLKNYSS